MPACFRDLSSLRKEFLHKYKHYYSCRLCWSTFLIYILFSAAIYTIEFQKRGLPHAHIVLWMAEPDKLLSPEAIDAVISVEIPDKDADPLAFEIVSQLMMHGPCGEANPKCSCMMNGKCMKHYPRMFCNNTTMDQNGYALYRRRNTGRTVEASNGIHLDNRCLLHHLFIFHAVKTNQAFSFLKNHLLILFVSKNHANSTLVSSEALMVFPHAA